MQNNTDNSIIISKDIERFSDRDIIPVSKSHQLIIAMVDGKYNFTDNDKRSLYRHINGQDHQLRVDQTIKNIQKDDSLNPLKNPYTNILKLFLYFIFLIVQLILWYLLIGVFIFFLGDPVICFLYIYFILIQFSWKGGCVFIEWTLEQSKFKGLKSFLQKENKYYYEAKQIIWSVGGKGKWIQVDFKDIKKR